MIALLALLVAGAGPPADYVVIRHPLRPTDVVVTAAASCGRNRFEIGVKNVANRNLLSLRVNGRSVAGAEIAKVTAVVPSGYFMFEPAVAECFRDRPSARLRLTVDGPPSHGNSQFLYFEVTPRGQVTNAHLD